MRSLTLTTARRLAVVSQRLGGDRHRSDRQGILDTVRALRHLQLDPTNAVARSHLLVLWSRLGRYDPADLDALLWKQRRLFEYRAFIYPTEDYPIHEWRMRYFARGDTPWPRRVRAFLEKNRALRRHILTRLRREGPLLSRQFEDRAVTPWHSSGWSSGRNVSLMLEFLSAKGLIMVAAREDGQRLWDLTERCLPVWTLRERLTEREFSRRVAERMLTAMGVDRVATPRWWVTAPSRGLRTGPGGILADLEREGRVERVQIRSEGRMLPGRWYLSAAALPVLERLEGEWNPRTTLLSPFDTLIIDRTRTEQLFDFRYRMEIYVPKAKRQYGYFVMPILHGDRLIGRIDAAMDHTRSRLIVNAVYAEADAPAGLAAGRAVARAVEELAAFLSAREINYGRQVPPAWKRALHS